MSALVLLAQDGPSPAMTTGGWIFMILAWVSVTCLLLWCFKRVLGGRSGPR